MVSLFPTYFPNQACKLSQPTQVSGEPHFHDPQIFAEDGLITYGKGEGYERYCAEEAVSLLIPLHQKLLYPSHVLNLLAY